MIWQGCFEGSSGVLVVTPSFFVISTTRLSSLDYMEEDFLLPDERID
jgi:hypothetical protein